MARGKTLKKTQAKNSERARLWKKAATHYRREAEKFVIGSPKPGEEKTYSLAGGFAFALARSCDQFAQECEAGRFI